MIDISTEDYNRPNYRQAGKEKSGKLLKGAIQESTSRSNTASIPYKFETILYRNTNPKGFAASSQRFFENEGEIAPGPGAYEKPAPFFNKVEGPSFSKKGTGGFASNSTRSLYKGYVNTGPGPGAYDYVDKPFKVTHINSDSMSVVSGTTAASTVSIKTVKSDAPGPGQYNPRDKIISNFAHPKNVGSVFKSSTVRSTENWTSMNPPPGTYNIDRSIMHKKTFKHYLSSANFMMPSRKKVSEDQVKKEIAFKHLGKLEELKVKQTPGPGEYINRDREAEIAEIFSQRVHDKNSANFTIDNSTRFGEPIDKRVKKVIVPGPGSYIPVTTFPADRALVSGSAFMSETSRNPFGSMDSLVAPTKYHPELVPKKSYHLNVNKLWV